MYIFPCGGNFCRKINPHFLFPIHFQMLETSFNLCKSVQNAGQVRVLSVNAITDTSQDRWQVRARSMEEPEKSFFPPEQWWWGRKSRHTAQSTWSGEGVPIPAFNVPKHQRCAFCSVAATVPQNQQGYAQHSCTGLKKEKYSPISFSFVRERGMYLFICLFGIFTVQPRNEPGQVTVIEATKQPVFSF